MTMLIGAKALATRLESGERIVVLDVRWRLGDPNGYEQYLAGHLPGAVFVDLASELAGTPEQAAGMPGGRHPLPAPAAFQESARRWGLNDGDVVVAYDDAGGQSAARLWWMLSDAGHKSVLLLDGGLSAWTSDGQELEVGPVSPRPGGANLSSGCMPRIDAAAASLWPGHGILLDARAGERYRGETEPVDPRAGHIPGAVSAPTSENLAADGTFLNAAQLRERFAALGADGAAPIAVYCGSGVTAAHELAALEIAGIPGALYPGSYSEWSRDPAREVALGTEPGWRPGAGQG